MVNFGKNTHEVNQQKKMISGQKCFGLIFFLGLIVSLLPIRVSGQQKKIQTGISIAPPFTELVFDKLDKEKNFILTITNHGHKSEVFRLSVVDLGGLEESAGVPFLGTKNSELEKKYSLSSWIILGKDALVVDPQKKVDIKITIQNKESLSPGGHYGAVIVKLDNSDKSGTDVVEVNQNFASLIFVKKIGGEIYDLKLNQTTIQNSYLKIPDTIELRFQNSGNIHVVPRGTLELKDPSGRLIAKGVINKASSIILPESFRTYQNRINQLKPAWLPGKYHLTVNYRFDGSDQISSLTKDYLYLGWLPYAVFGVTIVTWFWFLRSKKSKKQE
ncbi:MAG: hypothetical protein WC841_05840 [Candidatus Shapirobacteria bacterium]|jgi:hypothetical protein